jgi:hypothetical protein
VALLISDDPTARKLNRQNLTESAFDCRKGRSRWKKRHPPVTSALVDGVLVHAERRALAGT